MGKLVRELMRPSLISCQENTRLGEAVAMLARHRVHALIVSDPGGLAVGVLSDIDILAGAWLAGDEAGLAALRSLTVGQMMSKPAISVDADTPAADAAAQMLAQHIHRLVVSELERPVGVIAVSDLIGGLAVDGVEHSTVAAAMSQGIVVCRETTPIRAAARAMHERHSRSLVVVNPHGRPLGVVTGFDLLPLYSEGDTGQPVSSVMHAPHTIKPQASLREAAATMLREHIHRLVVVDPSEPESMPLGLISTADIVAEMAAPGSTEKSRA